MDEKEEIEEKEKIENPETSALFTQGWTRGGGNFRGRGRGRGRGGGGRNNDFGRGRGRDQQNFNQNNYFENSYQQLYNQPNQQIQTNQYKFTGNCYTCPRLYNV